MATCANCGKPIDDEKFCRNCGTPTGKVDTESSPSADSGESAEGETVTAVEPESLDETTTERRPASVVAPVESVPVESVPVESAPVESGPTESIAEAAPDAPPVQPATPGAAARFFGSISAAKWVAAGVHGLVAYAAAWILALVATLLALLSLRDVAVDWSWLGLFPAQWVGLSLGGVFSTGVSMAGVSASASLLWAPLLFTAVVIVVLVVASRREERLRPTAGRGQRWLLSVVSGIVIATVATILAAVLRPGLSTAAFQSAEATSLFGLGSLPTVSGSAASVSLFFGALVLATLVTLVARTLVARTVVARTVLAKTAASNGVIDAAVADAADVRVDATAVAPSSAARVVGAAARATVPVAVLYATVVGVAVALLAIITLVSQGAASTLLSALFWLPTVALDGVATLNFSVLSLSGPLTSYPGFPSSSTTYSLVGSLPWWGAVLAVVVNLVLLVIVATALRLRRVNNGVAVVANWISTVAAFLVLGVVVSVLGSIALWSNVDTTALTQDTSGLAGLGASLVGALASTSLTFGPAPWTFLVFALVGALVEAAAVWVAPLILRALPERSLGRVRAVFARVGVPALSPSGNEQPPNAPLAPSTRRALVIGGSIAGGVVVLVVAGAVAIGVLNSVVYSPQRQAEKFFDSVVAHHAAEAIDIGNVSTRAGTRSLLTDAVLGHTKETVSAYRITGTAISAGRAIVTAKVTQAGGSSSTISLRVHRAGSQFLVFDQWELDPVELPTMTVSVPHGADAVAVNGTTIRAAEDTTVVLPVFPGEYSVGIPDDDKWITAEKSDLHLSMTTRENVVLQILPSEALQKEATKQVTAFLDACAASHDIRPADCPFGTFAFGDVSNVVWSISQPPTFDLRQSTDGWAVTTADPGTASVSYTEQFFGDSSAESDTDEFYIDGLITIDGDTATYKYNDFGF